MTRLAAVLAVLTAGSTLAPSAAEACREHCQIRPGGAVRVRIPPIRVAWPRAHIVIRGPILGYGGVVHGPPPPPPPPPVAELPPPPPPAPTPPPYEEPPEPMPETRVYAAARPRDPTVGIGVRGSALRVGRNGPEATGIAALLRFRARPVELELEVGRDEYTDVAREDTRLGVSLYLPLVSNRFAPYLVAGAGMNFASFDLTGDELHQGYLAVGGGVSWRLGRRFSIAADARYFLRRYFDSDEMVAANDVFRTNGDPTGLRDQGVEGRLIGILYF
jgi:hypothetical protein